VVLCEFSAIAEYLCQIETAGGEKLFFATFTSRDKSFLMIRKLWQLALNNKVPSCHSLFMIPMNCSLIQAATPQEMWDWAEQGYQEHDLNVSDDEEIRSFTVGGGILITECLKE
jgi:hypothetical protein